MSIKFESFKGTGGGAVTGGLVYKGSYNATTSSPSLVTAKKGDFYIVSVAGTLAGITLNVGDHIVFNQDAANPVTSAMFDTIDNTDAVASVNSQTGVVVLNAANVGALAITSTLCHRAMSRTTVFSESAGFFEAFLVCATQPS